jgi:hypothetical protein
MPGAPDPSAAKTQDANQRPPLDKTVLRALPPLRTPPRKFVAAFPDVVTRPDVKRLNLFLRLAEKTLDDIRARGLYGCDCAPRAGFTRGWDYYASDPARLFGLASSMNRYSQNHGRTPDLVRPTTGTEKLLVAKMFAEIPDGPPADKLKAETYVPEDLRGLLSPVTRVWQSETPAIPKNEDVAPGRYFLKTNFGAGNNIAVEYPLDAATADAFERQVRRWFERRHLHGFWAAEWWYHLIEPRVYLEQNLAAEGEDIADWKFWVAGGRLQFVQVDQDRSTQHVQRVYDRDFNLLPDELYYQSDSNADPRPERFADVVRVAEAIGTNLEFARVDFFLKGSEVFLGEITLCPFGAKKAMRSPDLDQRLGQGWQGTRLFS